jgi:hypothetical protein
MLVGYERDGLGFYPTTVFTVTAEEQKTINTYYNGEVFTRREHLGQGKYVHYVQLTQKKLREVEQILRIKPVKA